MSVLFDRVKDNLILNHSEDDALIESYINAAISYAESYQHLPESFYRENPILIHNFKNPDNRRELLFLKNNLGIEKRKWYNRDYGIHRFTEIK